MSTSFLTEERKLTILANLDTWESRGAMYPDDESLRAVIFETQVLRRALTHALCYIEDAAEAEARMSQAITDAYLEIEQETK